MPLTEAVGTLIGGAISGVGSLFGNMMGSKNALKAVRETNQANRDLAEYAYQQDLAQWNRQNEYNTPTAQMERLKEAGLNPNLMYGQGNTGNASSSPSYNAPRMESYQGFGDYGASQAGQQLLSGLMGYAQIEKTKAETENIRQNTINLGYEENYKNLRNDYQALVNSKTKVEADFWKEKIKSEIHNLGSIGNRLDAQTNLTNLEIEQTKALMPIIYEKNVTELKQQLFNLDVASPAKIEKLMADTELTKIMQSVSSIQSKMLGIDLQYYPLDRQKESIMKSYQTEIREYEKELKRKLSQYGIRPDGNINQLFNGLLYNIMGDIDNFTNFLNTNHFKF